MPLSDLLPDNAKVIVRRALARLGVEIGAYTGSFAEHRALLIQHTGVTTVWDIGAHIGQYGARLRSSGYHGRVISVEPARAAFEQLLARTRRQPQWTALQVAISDARGESLLNLSRNGQSSSLLPMKARHVEVSPASQYIGTQIVQATTLDALRRDLSVSGPFYLKLDLQGSELAALRGASTVLSETFACEIELSFTDLYEGSSPWGEIVDYLALRDFFVCDMERVFFDPVNKDLLQVNALFRRKVVARALSRSEQAQVGQHVAP